MLELFRVHRERSLMYQQARMEAEHPNIVDKLGDLPIVNDAYNQVVDIYERTKGRNVLFRTSFGMAEYATKAIVGKAVPCVYNRFTQPAICQMNNIACVTLDAIGEKYPIIASPKEEIYEEGKIRAEAVYMMPSMAPLRKSVQIGKGMAEAGLDVGKTAFNIGTSVASTALAPARLACRVGTNVVQTGTNVSLSAAEKSMDVMRSVFERMYKTGELLVQTPYGQTCLKQFDLTLDATEKLLHQYLPEEEKDSDKVLETPTDRAARVTQLANRVHGAMMDKAKGDLVRFRLMVGSLMQEVLQVTGFYLTMTKDAALVGWADRKFYVDSFDTLWNKYVQFIPENVRPSDPLKRAMAVLGVVVFRMGEMLKTFLNSTLVTLDGSSNFFLKWCKLTEAFIQLNAKGDWANLMIYFINIVPRLTEVVQWLVQSAVSLLDSAAHVLSIPADLGAEELVDIGMGANCNGMGAVHNQHRFRNIVS